MPVNALKVKNNTLRHSFFPRSLREWRQLPQWPTRSPPPEAFMDGFGRMREEGEKEIEGEGERGGREKEIEGG